MAPKKTSRKKRPVRRTAPKKDRKLRVKSPEIIGLLLIFVGIFLFLSLISYDSLDPSWASTSSADQKIQNIAGRVGASVSEGTFQLFGLPAFLLPFFLFYFGIRLFFPRKGNSWLRLLACIAFLVIVGGLFTLIFSRVVWRGADLPAGGLIGHLLASFLIKYFNHIGSLLLLIILLLLFILFTTHLSLRKIMAAFSKFFNFSFQKVRIRITHYQKTKEKEKRKKAVLEKYAAQEEPKKTEVTKRKKEKKKEKQVPIKKPPTKKPASEDYLFPELKSKDGYQFPPYDILDWGKPSEKIDKDELFEKKQLIEEKLAQFKVVGEVREYHPGPVITTYEFFPDPGIKVSQVASLSEEVSLALEAVSVRIQRIPGKSSLGIEVPNNRREVIKLRDVIQSDPFQESHSKLIFALGKTVHGEVYTTDLTDMPHLLIAGATGTGKSVTLNSLITSILYKATPDEVKLILIDPKRLEFSNFEGIPHLISPVIKDPRKAEGILLDAIKKMEDRYKKLGLFNVRNIQQYNQFVGKLRRDKKGQLTEEEDERLKPLPYIVIIIDELAELMMVGAKEVEYCIARISQLARAVGIHLVMATQRPSIDVITGTIKTNFSSRIAFRVPSKIDSRIILDTGGAEKLLGNGDMLFMPPNYPRLIRLHGSHISLPEINRLVKFVKDQGRPEYDEKLIAVLKAPDGAVEEEVGEKDPIFNEAVELVLVTGQASASYLQRKLKLGYARAARIIDQMESEGIVGPSEGSKPREILVDPQSYLRNMKAEE
jgi:S-DNA-T family DNA segregation ATPase FtsK/SpoIIIE